MRNRVRVVEEYRGGTEEDRRWGGDEDLQWKDTLCKSSMKRINVKI